MDAVLLKALTDIMTARGGSPVVEAVFYPSVGPQVACKIRVDHNETLQPDGYDATMTENAVTLTALYQEVGEPARGESFTADGVTYTVAKIEENDRMFVKMVVNES